MQRTYLSEPDKIDDIERTNVLVFSNHQLTPTVLTYLI